MNRLKSLTQLKSKFAHYKAIDYLTVGLIVFASVVLLAVAVTFIMAVNTRLSSYKTPIPLTKEKYVSGEAIEGYFYGRKLYNGKVIITRNLSCSDGYDNVLPSFDGKKNFVESILPARKIDGEKPRKIATVPIEVTVGASCFVTFNHTACVPYLFGCYNAEYAYVSKPFIVTDDMTGLQPTQEPTRSVPSDDGITPPAVNPSSNPIEQRNNQSPAVAENTTNGNITPIEDNGTSQLTPLQQTLQTINDAAQELIANPIDRIFGAIHNGK